MIVVAKHGTESGMRRLGIIAVVAAAACLAAEAARAQEPDSARDNARDNARDEVRYARVLAQVADSAIHRLDFFPARAQTRVQMLFLAANDSMAVVFADLHRHSAGAALALDELIGRMSRATIPDDLHGLHAQLMSALGSARSALDRLTAASAGCQMGVASVQRCQSPFTSAALSLADAYRSYL